MSEPPSGHAQDRKAQDAHPGANHGALGTIPGDLVDDFAFIEEGAGALASILADSEHRMSDIDAARWMAYSMNHNVEAFTERLEVGRAKP